MKSIIETNKNSGKSLQDFILKKKSLLKFKIKGMVNSAGRNNQGKITSYHKGGGHKKKIQRNEF